MSDRRDHFPEENDMKVKFKTKRGRKVSFSARKGGKRRKGRRTKQQSLLGKAAKACKGKGPIGGKQRTGCIRTYLKKHG